MAVSNREIEELRRRQLSLSAELERAQRELGQTRQMLTAENRLALEQLRSDTERRLASRDQSLRQSYDTLLRETSSAQEAALEQEFRQYQQQYADVTAELEAALAREHQQTEALLLRQREFERAYYARQEYAQERAAQSKRSAESAVQQAADNAPIDWFLPGHIDLYSQRLRELGQWMTNGFFESVIGIGENLILNVRLDVLETEKQYRRWLHYFTVIRSVLDAQRTLLFDTAVRVPDDLTRFARSRDIHDGIMGEETLAYWSDGAYRELTGRYEQTRLELRDFELHGTLDLDESALRAYMIAHPEQSARLQPEQLYRLAVQLTAQLADAEETVRRMRQRMQAFEERMVLLEALRTALRQAGYPVTGTELTGKPGEALRIRFSDHLYTMEFEVLLIPLLRRADSLWVNQAVCTIPDDCGPERQEELTHCLADVFTARGIALAFREVRDEQDAQERLALAVTDMQMKINGRLN